MIAALVLSSALALRLASRATRTASAWRRAAPAGAPVVAPLVAALSTRLLRTRRERAVDRALPDVLDAIARSLRSGASLRLAVDEAARTARGALGEDLTTVTEAVRDGAALPDALERWARHRSLPGVRLATAALCLGAETGGASAQAVDGVAATLRMNLAIAGEVRALSSQARLSALVIALAPLAFSLLAVTADGTTATFLLGTPFGLTCLALGLGLDALGWFWMHRLTAVVA